MASERLAQMVTCPICLCELTEPRALRCLHTFCLACVRQLESSSSRVSCPTCRMYSTIPRGGLKNLPVNFHMNELRDIREGLASVQEDSSEAEQPSEVVRTCLVHRGKALCLYCVTCDRCVCTGCWSENHGRHDRRKVSDVVGVKRAALSSVVMVADIHLADLMSSFNEPDEEGIAMATLTSISEHANNLLQSADNVTIVESTAALEQRLQTWQRVRHLSLEWLQGSQESLPHAPMRGELSNWSNVPLCEHLFDFNALHGVADGNTIAVIGDKLYIAGTNSIGVYLLDGVCFSALNTQTWESVSGIAATPSDELLVVDRGRRKVMLMSTEGKVLQVFGKGFLHRITGILKEPVGVAAMPDGKYVVTDTEQGSLYVFKGNGNVSEWIQKSFSSPNCVAVADDNTLVVCEGDGNVTYLPESAKAGHSYNDRTSLRITSLSVRSLVNAGHGQMLYAVHDSVRLLRGGSGDLTVTQTSDPRALGYHNGRLYVGHRNGTVRVYRYNSTPLCDTMY